MILRAKLAGSVLSDSRRVFGLVVELLDWTGSVRPYRKKCVDLDFGDSWCVVLSNIQQYSKTKY